MGQKRHSGEDGEKPPFCRKQMHGAEGPDEEGDFGYGKLQEKTRHKGCQHQFVAQMAHAKDGGVDIAHTDGMEEL